MATFKSGDRVLILPGIVNKPGTVIERTLIGLYRVKQDGSDDVYGYEPQELGLLNPVPRGWDSV